MSRALVPVLVLAPLLAAAGCGGDGEDAVPTALTLTEEPGESAACTNEASGYRVEYPSGSHVDDGDVSGPCSYFHPEPFEVPEATEFVDVAVLVSREPVPLDVIAGDDPSRAVLELEETEIAGSRAVRMKAEATGEGLFDAGTRHYQVAVEADGETVILSTFDVGELDYERNKEVVDEMADSLELLG